MFKYISEILSKFTQKQRVIALLLVLLSIVVITLGPKLIDSLTYDDTELRTITSNQRNQILELSGEVGRLQTELIKSKSECTDLVIQRETEILQMIEDLQRGIGSRNMRLERITTPQYEIIQGDTIMMLPNRREVDVVPHMMDGLNTIKNKIKKDINKINE